MKNAQEAHEAIRPAGDSFRTPGEVANAAVQRRVPALRADLAAHRRLADGRRGRHDGVGAPRRRRRSPTSAAEFATSGRTITFPGFLRAYVEDTDETDAEKRRRREAAAAAGPRRRARRRASSSRPGHTTTPPARYTEASLVKAMEELGIGRPSTYASIMQTIQDRGYVWKKGAGAGPVLDRVRRDRPAASPTSAGWSTTASPRRSRTTSTTSPAASASRVDWLQPVLLRRPTRPVDATPERISAQGGLKRLIATAAGGDRRPRGQLDPARRHGRRRAGRSLRPVPAARRRPRRAARLDPRGPRAGRADPGEGRGAARRRRPAIASSARPTAGREITAKAGRYGPYVTDGEKTASLFKTMSLDTVTLDEAERAADAAAHARRSSTARTSPRRTAATARTSRRAPTRARSRPRSSCSRSPSTRRAAIFAQPKQRGRRAAAAPPLRSSATTRCPASRWWSRTAGSARTSPTARRTRRCARATRSRRSPTSGRPSCWPTGVPAARPRRPRARPRRRPRRRPPRRRPPPRRPPPRRPPPRRLPPKRS